jgi:hypothetical protein
MAVDLVAIAFFYAYFVTFNQKCSPAVWTIESSNKAHVHLGLDGLAALGADNAL